MAAAKKPNIFVRSFTAVKKFFKEFRSEIKKITWPSWSQTFNNTAVVVVMVLIMGAFIWLLDFAFASALDLVVGLVL